MSNRLEGKTALITGAGSGIGRAIAQVFAREGARVAVADIDAESALITLESLHTEGLVVEMDVSSKHAVSAGVGQAIETFSQLDILVNNAGKISFSSFESCPESDWN